MRGGARSTCLLIAPSILINYGLARGLEQTRDTKPARAKTLLVAGILFNLCFLGYFKYLNFFESSLNDAFGAGFVLTQLILPLGISFITFQKIAFLVDVQAAGSTNSPWPITACSSCSSRNSSPARSSTTGR